MGIINTELVERVLTHPDTMERVRLALTYEQSGFLAYEQQGEVCAGGIVPINQSEIPATSPPAYPLDRAKIEESINAWTQYGSQQVEQYLNATTPPESDAHIILTTWKSGVHEIPEALRNNPSGRRIGAAQVRSSFSPVEYIQLNMMRQRGPAALVKGWGEGEMINVHLLGQGDSLSSERFAREVNHDMFSYLFSNDSTQSEFYEHLQGILDLNKADLFLE